MTDPVREKVDKEISSIQDLEPPFRRHATVIGGIKATAPGNGLASVQCVRSINDSRHVSHWSDGIGQC